MPSGKQFMIEQQAQTAEKIGVWQNRVAMTLFFVMMCGVPMYLTPNRYMFMTGEKYTFLVICMRVIFCAVTAVFVLKIIKGYRPFSDGLVKALKKPTITDWAAIAFAVITLLSALFSPFSDRTDVWHGYVGRYDGAFTQFIFVAIFFLMAYWYKPNLRDFGIFGITAIVVGVIGVFQFFGMDFFRLWPNHLEEFFRENYYTLQFRTTLGNINIVSTYACVSALLCGFLFVFTDSKWRPVWIAASALNLWMLVFTSDSGRLGTIAAVIVTIPFIVFNRKLIGRFLLLASSWAGAFTLHRLFYNYLILGTETIQRMTVYAVAAVVLLLGGLGLILWEKKKNTGYDSRVKWKLGVVILGAVFVVSIAGVEVVGRRIEAEANMIYQAREILHGRIDDEFGSQRVYIWRNALKAVPKYPVLGSGPDTFFLAFPHEAQGLYNQSYDKAHNEYLQILICQGILGLLAYLVFLGSLFVRAVPKALRFKNPLLFAATVTFFGYCVQAFFNISMPISSQMMWVTAGVMACCLRLEKHENQ
jgi:O-antigen ligase